MEKNTLYKNHGLFQDSHVEKNLSKQMIDKLLDDYLEHGPQFRKGFQKGKKWGTMQKPKDAVTVELLIRIHSHIGDWIRAKGMGAYHITQAKLLMNEILRVVDGI